MTYRNEEQLYKDVNTRPSNFVMLYEMMAEYNKLNKDQKRKYMDILTGWSIREKDILNLDKDKH